MHKIIPRSKKVRTSITVEERIWKKFQQCAALKGKDASEYVMDLIKRELEEKKEEFEHLYNKQHMEWFNHPSNKKLFDNET